MNRREKVDRDFISSMSFQEKTTWVELACVLLVYGVYFFDITTALSHLPVADISYQSAMLRTVGLLIALIIIGAIVVASLAPDEADTSDERDRIFGWRGEAFGAYVLSAGMITALIAAMMEIEHFWIANGLLLGLVLAELASGACKLLLYRGAI